MRFASDRLSNRIGVHLRQIDSPPAPDQLPSSGTSKLRVEPPGSGPDKRTEPEKPSAPLSVWTSVRRGSASRDASLGKILGPSFAQEAMPEVIGKLIDVYSEQRTEEEGFIDTYQRIGIDDCIP